ncbi:hypothetical protein KCP75_04640 [Salmonella enterica subsp. enterica]|nr:hypothetical protein KCP75_04640 [Salmonella enterica subsp. enterica]
MAYGPDSANMGVRPVRYAGASCMSLHHRIMKGEPSCRTPALMRLGLWSRSGSRVSLYHGSEAAAKVFNWLCEEYG